MSVSLSCLHSADTQADGAGRASVRMLAQALGKEFLDVHVVQYVPSARKDKSDRTHSTIANGGISDEDGDAQKEGKKMNAETVYVFTSTPDGADCRAAARRTNGSLSSQKIFG